MKPQSGDRRPCRGCGVPIIFLADSEGKIQPLDLQAPTWRIEQDLMGQEIAVRADALVSHFSSCPKADDFSKSKRK
jgi:hypothetical protein